MCNIFSKSMLNGNFPLIILDFVWIKDLSGEGQVKAKEKVKNLATI